MAEGSIDRSGRWPEAGAGLTSEREEDANLTQAVFELLESTPLGSEDFAQSLGRIETQYGDQTFTQLLTLLCHLRFEPGEARRHWLAVIEHRKQLEEKWGAPVDLRVGLASYFINVEQQLKNPTIIEMRLFERTQAFAYRDELTGLRNYRFFELYLYHELDRSDQYSWPLSLVLVDVDDFKGYNDRHGHVAGNEALARIGELVVESCRRVDIAARFGGEEFAVILPATPKLGAEGVAERIRAAVEAESWSLEQITVSVGLATHPGDAERVEELIENADRAMYTAKARGKNQVVRYGESRRSHRRIAVEITGRLMASSPAWTELTTIDASEGGFRFESQVELVPNTLVDMRLELSDRDEHLTAACRVVNCSEASGGNYVTSVRVVDLSNLDRHHLTRYLRAAEAGSTEAS